MMRHCVIVLIVVALVAGAAWLVGCPRYGGWGRDGGGGHHHHDRD